MTKIKTTGLKVRRILLISDTHGNLDIINEKVNQTQADMVIHAGDFGFYDEQSIYRLSHQSKGITLVSIPLTSLATI
ncbi:metallophosphoesterase family protein [Legionella quateirensis]|uniref:metallophosphoesterase family protein n=1 Tax=Legionella quateirensis TaxID=45072 RepID=UPI001EE772C8|nr:metallophosphoesterase family protein [Legionella quateirensis]